MRINRISKAIGVAAVSALALTACASSSNGGSSSSGGDDTKTITVAEVNKFSSLNSSSANGNSDINNKVAGLTHNGFYHVDADLNIVHNEDFGTYETISEDPLKVEYKLNDDVEWSDGNKVDEADLLLAWASLSGHFDSEEEGGVTYFEYAGDSEGLGGTDLPEMSDDGLTMTLEYENPYIDWESAYDVGLPAHVVAEKAGLSEEELVETIKTATPGEENENLSKIAEVWNNDFDTTTMPSDESLLVSSGPFKIKDIQENESVTLERNDKYTGEKPKIDEIIIRTLGDANAQIQALSNGEADVISPQPSVDTIQQLRDLGSVNIVEGQDLAYDHLDLNFNSETFADEATREAFLLTIPRQAIVDRLQKPMSDEAQVLNSQIFVASEDPYEDAVKENGSDEFSSDDMDANIERAKELLDGKTPTVRILYNNENPVRADTYAMIRESASKAGFKVEDAGSPDWSKQLKGGDYEASIFGWVSPGVGHSSYGQIFATGGGGNYNGYSNSEVDALAAEIRKTVNDEDKVNELGTQVDSKLFEDKYGLPLFQSIGVWGVRDGVEGFDKFNPGSASFYWNVEEWDRK